MSEAKYIAPEGMRLAVAKAVFDACGKVDYHPQIRIALEAALRWQAEELSKSEGMSWMLNGTYQEGFCAAWKKITHMYDAPPEPKAPEPEISPTARRVIEMFRGVTLTPTDADAIMDNVAMVAHGWVRK